MSPETSNFTLLQCHSTLLGTHLPFTSQQALWAPGSLGLRRAETSAQSLTFQFCGSLNSVVYQHTPVIVCTRVPTHHISLPDRAGEPVQGVLELRWAAIRCQLESRHVSTTDSYRLHPHLFWKASLSRQGLWLKEEWHSTGMLSRQ